MVTEKIKLHVFVYIFFLLLKILFAFSREKPLTRLTCFRLVHIFVGVFSFNLTSRCHLFFTLFYWMNWIGLDILDCVYVYVLVFLVPFK